MKKYKPMHPLKRLRKVRRECLQIIVDIEYWNTHRTEHPPFDCEPEKVMVAKIDAAIAAWGTPSFDGLCDEVVGYADCVRAEDRS